METSQHDPNTFTINTFDIPQSVLRFNSMYITTSQHETSQHDPKTFTTNTFDMPQLFSRFSTMYNLRRHNMSLRRAPTTMALISILPGVQFGN